MLATFKIHALADAQAVPRVLEQFALRDLVPTSLTAERDGEEIKLVVESTDLDATLARIIAEKVRASVLIRTVHLSTVDDRGE